MKPIILTVALAECVHFYILTNLFFIAEPKDGEIILRHRNDENYNKLIHNGLNGWEMFHSIEQNLHYILHARSIS